MLSQKQITYLQKEILGWYAQNRRDLPWRHSRDPYNILVSEIMLQQTQVGRVIQKFTDWMERFPTIESLAKASMRDVLQYWSGLGYNRRALYLQRVAQEVVKNNNGIFSREEDELKKLPGIGEYTARALLCFAFNKQIAVVDTNVRKVIAVKLFNGNMPEEKILWQVAAQLLPEGRAYEWNQALMDYAASELKKEKIPIPKQSKFKDSDRYYRGQILKLLLHDKNILWEALFKEFPAVSRERLDGIVQRLEKDGFIIAEKNLLKLH